MIAEMKELGGLLWRAITFDMTPEEIKAGGKVLFYAAWRGGLIVSIALAYGGYFVRADEAAEAHAAVDGKIATALAPVLEAQKVQGLQISTLLTTWNISLRKGLASDIRLLFAKRCKEHEPAEWNRLTDQIDDAQEEYRKLRPDNEKYGPLSCGNP